jgi:hypothetical protein
LFSFYILHHLAVQIFTFSEEGGVEEPGKSLAQTVALPGFFLWQKNSRKGVREKLNGST